MNEYTDNPENLDKISKKMRELVLIMKSFVTKKVGVNGTLSKPIILLRHTP